MLSDQDKKEILSDALDPSRRQVFVDSRRRSLGPMSWAEYFSFLKSVQNFFGFTSKPHKITGEHFKL